MKHLSGALLYGELLALPTNIRLGWKGSLGTNALTFYEKAYLTAVKSFITFATGHWAWTFSPICIWSTHTTILSSRGGGPTTVNWEELYEGDKE